MIIGVPKEIKNNEKRVALTPYGANELIQLGHTVYIQIKTNGWADEKAIMAWLAGKAPNTIVLVINVKKKSKKQGKGWVIKNRFYWKMVKRIYRKDID